MDVVNDVQVLENIEVLETDVKDCNEKCQRVNCSAIYDAIMSSLKLLYDLICICCAKRKPNNKIFFRWRIKIIIII